MPAEHDAVLYARFSPRPNAEEARSIDTQRDRAREYADFHRPPLTLVGEFTDPDTSARRIPLGKREGGAKLLAATRRGKIKHVLAFASNRVFRDTRDGLNVMEQWGRDGVALHLISQGGNIINTTSALGKLLATYIFAVDAYMPEANAEVVSASMLRHQTNGYVMGSIARYGQKVVGTQVMPSGKIRRLTEPDPDEQATIDRMATWRLQGASLQEIADRLNHEQVPSRGRMSGGVKLEGWTRQAVRKILINERQIVARA